jgi:hypothetical protein
MKYSKNKGWNLPATRHFFIYITNTFSNSIGRYVRRRTASDKPVVWGDGIDKYLYVCNYIIAEH